MFEITQEILLSIITAIFSVLIGAIMTLVGIVYHRLRTRVRELEDLVNKLEEAIMSNKNNVDISHEFMFGREEDDANVGISKKILNIRKRLEKLINALHDEESLDFDRKDIK